MIIQCGICHWAAFVTSDLYLWKVNTRDNETQHTQEQYLQKTWRLFTSELH